MLGYGQFGDNLGILEMYVINEGGGILSVDAVPWRLQTVLLEAKSLSSS